MKSINTHLGDEAEQVYTLEDSSFLLGVILEKYTQYNSNTGRYILEIDDALWEKFSAYYGGQKGVEKFFHVKKREYLGILIVLFLLRKTDPVRRFGGRLLSIKKDFGSGVDAIITLGKKRVVEIDLTQNPGKKLKDNGCTVYIPDGIINPIFHQLETIQDKNTFQEVFDEYTNDLNEKSVVYYIGSQEISASQLIEYIRGRVVHQMPTSSLHDTGMYIRAGKRQSTRQ